MANIEIGLKYKASLEISPKYTVPGNADRFPAFGIIPPVMATAMLVAFIEETAVKAILPFLEEGENSLGTLVNFTHIAPTPIGFIVTVEVEVIAIEGRKVRFKVKCYDDIDVISEGIHERGIINEAKFLEKLNRKQKPL